MFDMDGVLLDSEPFWQDAEIDLFADVGIRLTRADGQATMGMRIEEVVAFRHSESPWPIEGPGAVSLADLAHSITDRVIDLIVERAVALPGVHEALDAIAAAGFRLALATSSPYRYIDAVVAVLGIQGRFEVLHSAEDEARGKPDPAVFVTAAAKLGVEPTTCVAIEDSPNGVRAALGAGMACIAIPEAGHRNHEAFSQADLVLGSLADLDVSILGPMDTGIGPSNLNR